MGSILSPTTLDRAAAINGSLTADADGIVVGDGGIAANVSSRGDQDLVLQTGNAVSGTITITDGADGDIVIAPNGAGNLQVAGGAGLVSDTLAGQAQFIPAADQAAVTGGTLIIPLTPYSSLKTTGGAEALTLANGTLVGQLKRILLVATGGDGTLTGTGFASIVFSAVGDEAILAWDGTGWLVVETNNALGTAATPVVNLV